MCGIVALFLKNPALEPRLGALFAPMLRAMGDRGPDSAGFAIYGTPAPPGATKLTLFHPDEKFDWVALANSVSREIGGETGRVVALRVVASHAVWTVPGDGMTMRAALRRLDWRVRVMGAGEVMELYKQKGTPGEIADRFAIAKFSGSHAIGHTRMATESAVTTEHSHPFSTGPDICLVHNGSLSNHNRLRRSLARGGIEFTTDNDTEVAAGYLADRMQHGTRLHDALEGSLKDLDGFFTFATGSKDGFAVLRDAIGCKPAVLAETEDWVAMGSEYRALAHLPGARGAEIWEPQPAKVYSWGRA